MKPKRPPDISSSPFFCVAIEATVSKMILKIARTLLARVNKTRRHPPTKALAMNISTHTQTHAPTGMTIAYKVQYTATQREIKLVN